ncbi:MAG: XdhC family protein [Pseudomonadota bacterium]
MLCETSLRRLAFMDLETSTLLDFLSDRQAAGSKVLLATVAHTWGSSPRPAGAMMAIDDAGAFVGSVSGGCIESELIDKVSCEFPETLMTWHYSSDDNRSLPCGGKLDLVIEPRPKDERLSTLRALAMENRRVKTTFDLAQQVVQVDAADTEEVGSIGDGRVVVIREPQWRLLIAGAGELSALVCRMALMLGYAVEVCEPREAYRFSWPVEEVPVAPAMPDDWLLAAGVTETTAIVALTHDPKVDDLAMLAAVETNAFYVGALGSARTSNKRRTRLREHFDLSTQALSRIVGPIGIDLGTRRAPEIALAVMADITARRNAVSIESSRVVKAVSD